MSHASPTSSSLGRTAGPSPGPSLRHRLPRLSSLGPVIALLLACTFFSFQSDRFLSVENFSLVLQQVMVVGTIAIGQTLVILTAGIDLSCGMVMALLFQRPLYRAIDRRLA